MRCPNCTGPTTEIPVERLYGRSQTIDVCHGCQLIWFDGAELLQMAPGGTLQLVALLADDHVPAAPRVPLKSKLRCPRCAATLLLVHDMQRGTKFQYLQCEAGHGRLLTFYQFLRAKDFVRSLGASEIQELREHVRQVNCANCGAPVDVEQGAVCGFCRTPIAILDPDQLRTALAEIRQTLDRRTPDATLPLQLALERLRAERAFFDQPTRSTRASLLDVLFGDASDPVLAGLKALSRALR